MICKICKAACNIYLFLLSLPACLSSLSFPGGIGNLGNLTVNVFAYPYPDVFLRRSSGLTQMNRLVQKAFSVRATTRFKATPGTTKVMMLHHV